MPFRGLTWMIFKFLPKLRLWILRSDCFTRIISSILGHLLASSYDQSVVFIVFLLLCLQLAFTEASSYNCIHWNICVYKWSRRWLPEIVRLYFLSLLVLVIWEWLLHIFVFTTQYNKVTQMKHRNATINLSASLFPDYGVLLNKGSFTEKFSKPLTTENI